jgi:tetratricopeptide (TPR) repeat protein
MALKLIADDTSTSEMQEMTMPLSLPGLDAIMTTDAGDNQETTEENADSLLQVQKQHAYDAAIAAYDALQQSRAQGEPEQVYFPKVYNCHSASSEATNILDSDSPEFNRVKNILRELIRYLEEGAFYYSGVNNSSEMVKFSRAFVDLKTMEIFSGENLQVNEAYYPSLIYCAASGAYNARDYESAIKYFKAYFSTGDTRYREQIYIFMGQACINTKNYTLAVTTLREGAKLYPQNYSLLQLAIQACIDGGMAEYMQGFLDQALFLKPTDETMLNIQGKVYEDGGEYQKALDLWRKLDLSHPNNLSIAKHMGLCFYNIATTYTNMAVGENDEKVEKKYRRQAKNYFSDAVQKLSEVTASDPTAVKYLKALAVSYLFLDDKAMFQDVNTRLQALGEDPMSEMYMPPTLNYNDNGGRNYDQAGTTGTDNEIPSYSEYAKPLIEEHLAKWTRRGEFEKIVDYQKRVNDMTITAEYNKISDQTAHDYLEKFGNKLRINDLKLQPYDANNEVYKIESAYGPILINVPLKNNEAELFRATWSATRFKSPKFYIKNDRVQLASITFVTPTNRSYTYNVDDDITYSNTHVDIDFEAILHNSINSNNNLADNSSSADNSVRITLKSDVDTDIPENNKQNANTVAVIIANEDYNNVSKVRSALNDGEAFKLYCNKTLGIPEQNIRFYSNATLGTMLRSVADLRHTVDALGSNPDVIFYYAGHGMPDESTHDSFLLPVDADGMVTESCYALARLYSELSSLKASSVMVFLDACFSGAQRDGGMLMSARGVVLKAKSVAPTGNMFVLSAASDKETALPYTEKNHGMFTYYLLKKLQESKGNTTLKELSEYVIKNVKMQSNLINKKPQTPAVSTSGSMVQNYAKKKLRN